MSPVCRIFHEYITTFYKCEIEGLPRGGFPKGKHGDNVGKRPETKQQLGENEYLLVPGYMYYKKYLLVYN